MEPSSCRNSLFTPNNSLIQDSSSPSLSNPEERSSQVQWSWEENKVFENALAEFGLESGLLLPTLALRIPTKSISHFKEHLKALEDDINMVQSSEFDEILDLLMSDIDDSSQASKNNEQQAPNKKSEASRSVPRERRKPTPWTKTEHEMFLLGLERYGKGDWRSISRHLVPSKTPVQIASHAQKYFLKLKNPNSHTRKDGSVAMRTVDDSQKLAMAAENAQLAISDDNKP